MCFRTAAPFNCKTAYYGRGTETSIVGPSFWSLGAYTAWRLICGPRRIALRSDTSCASTYPRPISRDLTETPTSVANPASPCRRCRPSIMIPNTHRICLCRCWAPTHTRHCHEDLPDEHCPHVRCGRD